MKPVKRVNTFKRSDSVPGHVPGPVGDQTMAPKNPHRHNVTNWTCSNCRTRFFFRAEAVCNVCGICQSCGMYNADPETKDGCMCGNVVDDASQPVLRRRVVRSGPVDMGG